MHILMEYFDMLSIFNEITLPSAFFLSCTCMYYIILLKISAMIFSFPFLKV